MSGITNASGEFVLTGNPFDFDSTGYCESMNALVVSIHGTDTSYNWMPYNEVANSFFENSVKPYQLVITH